MLFMIILIQDKGARMDIMYIGIAIALFVASWFFMKVIERV
jgi:hypothetical protein